MKKYIMICIVSAIAGIVIGFCMNQIMHNNDTIMIATQNAALEQAEKVMWNNNIFDADGSDDMELYLELSWEVDSLWNK